MSHSQPHCSPRVCSVISSSGLSARPMLGSAMANGEIGMPLFIYSRPGQTPCEDTLCKVLDADSIDLGPDPVPARLRKGSVACLPGRREYCTPPAKLDLPLLGVVGLFVSVSELCASWYAPGSQSWTMHACVRSHWATGALWRLMHAVALPFPVDRNRTMRTIFQR